MDHDATSSHHVTFGPFRLDIRQERLWRGNQELVLRPKALAVLRYLIEHRERLVTKEELLKTLWAGTYVSDTVLKVCVREIRAVLGDEAAQPRFIETVRWRGYRFIAPLTTTRPVASSLHPVVSSQEQSSAQRQDFHPTPNTQHLTPYLVGREAELAQLQGRLERALSGERQVLFVTGEAGIGKTTLIDTFLAQLVALHPSLQSPTPFLWLGRGQCLEQYGGGEAYLPMLEALGQLCRGPDGNRVIDLLGRYAPTWLVQMPGLVREVDLEALQRKVAGATRERMLREMAEALAALTEERGLVLVLEDLHWSDRSTLEFIAYLAQRRERARLLIIGTYRPAEVVVASGHPLKGIKQEPQAHGLCAELQLELLAEGDVEEYLVKRFGTDGAPRGLAKVIHRRTDGNALFMVNLVEYCVQQEVLVKKNGHWQLRGDVTKAADATPESLRQLIAKQIEMLRTEEQQVLEVASVVGPEFVVASVAAALKSEPEAVEEVCEALARTGHFLQGGVIVEWPDGTLSGRYAFRHALYQTVLYERIAAVRRVRLHRVIGEHEERVYGERAKEIAAELAMHFERGRDIDRAIHWLRQAGENTVGRNAPHEAITHFTKGLALLQTLPDTPERMSRELTLQIALGTVLMITKGFAAAEVREVYDRARELCQQIGDTPQIIPVLRGLWSFYNARAEFPTSRVLAEQLLRLTEDGQDVLPHSAAHLAVGVTAYFRGEFVLAQEQLEQGITLFDLRQHNSPAVLAYGPHPGLICLFYLPLVLWLRGYPNQALQKCDEGLTLARQLSHPHSQAFASIPATILRQFRREEKAVQEQAEAGITLCREHGFSVYSLMDTIIHGWALTELGHGEEGIAQMRQSLVSYQVAGAGLARPYFLALLAEAYGRTGQPEEGLTVLAEALAIVRENGERVWEAEMYRLKGELLLQSSVQSLASSVQKSSKSKVQSLKSKKTSPQSLTPNPQAEAEACFLKAIEIARQQQAKSLELRATVSLAQLWQCQGKQVEARQMLAEIYDWFTEGFATRDLQDAKMLLEELGH